MRALQSQRSRDRTEFAGNDLALRHRDDQKEDIMMTRAALAMCENIDWNVGRLLDKIDALNLRNDTIVVYFSDNGPNSYRWNGDMKGRKGSLDEGGLRSPFFLRWPNRIRAGLQLPQIAGAIDLLPTLTSLAGIEANVRKPLAGRDLTTLLLEQPTKWAPRTLLSVKNNQISVRTQRFRLTADGRLFDIEQDRGQRSDVANQYPQVAAQLQRQARQHAIAMQAAFSSQRGPTLHRGLRSSDDVAGPRRRTARQHPAQRESAQQFVL